MYVLITCYYLIGICLISHGVAAIAKKSFFGKFNAKISATNRPYHFYSVVVIHISAGAALFYLATVILIRALDNPSP